jgi:hypothetical protein
MFAESGSKDFLSFNPDSDIFAEFENSGLTSIINRNIQLQNIDHRIT